MDFLNHFRVDLLILLVALFLGISIYIGYSSTLPLTDKDLLDAKSKCPAISSYLPDSVITSYNLKISLDNCLNNQIISKQRAILK